MDRALLRVSARPALGALAAVALVAPTLTGCAASGAPATTPATAASAVPAADSSPSPSAHTHAASAAGAGAAAAGGEQGAAACVRLQALLAQHTTLVADMMRARIRNDPDFAQAAESAVTRNTQALSALVGSLLGADAAGTFAKWWQAHVADLFDYADARRTGDAARLKKARAALVTAEEQLAAFFAKASNGRLKAADARAAVRMHVDELLAQADAYSAHKYTAAAASYRTGYEHGFALGAAIGQALLPRADVATLAQPGWQLRSNLTQLLGEHVELVVGSMRAASGSQPADFQALGDALNRNTQNLSAAVGTLFGAPAAKRFQSLWADHVDALLTVTSATARGDSAAQQEGQRRLKAFEPSLASFINSATQSRLGADALARAFVMHDQMLLGEVQAYQAKNYSQAHDLSYRAYDEMFDLAAQLSHAMQLTLAGRLPRGGSQTGGGGMAAVVGGR